MEYFLDKIWPSRALCYGARVKSSTGAFTRVSTVSFAKGTSNSKFPTRDSAALKSTTCLGVSLVTLNFELRALSRGLCSVGVSPFGVVEVFGDPCPMVLSQVTCVFGGFSYFCYSFVRGVYGLLFYVYGYWFARVMFFILFMLFLVDFYYVVWVVVSLQSRRNLL